MSIGAPQHGGYNAQTASGNITLTAGDDLIQAIDPAGSIDVILPDLGSTGLGKVFIDNTADGPSEVISIKDGANGNALLATPSTDQSATCVFSEGSWVCTQGAAN